MKINCLRCETELEEYFFTPMTFLPYGSGHAHAMVECTRCGHVEFGEEQPAAQGHQGNIAYAEDGD